MEEEVVELVSDSVPGAVLLCLVPGWSLARDVMVIWGLGPGGGSGGLMAPPCAQDGAEGWYLRVPGPVTARPLGGGMGGFTCAVLRLSWWFPVRARRRGDAVKDLSVLLVLGGGCFRSGCVPGL